MRPELKIVRTILLTILHILTTCVDDDIPTAICRLALVKK